MYQALLVMFLLVAVSLVVLIMLQQNKSADTGTSLGVSPSGTLLGSSGSGNFMTRMTSVLATLFFILSLVLGNLSSNHGQKISQWDNLNQSPYMNKAPDVMLAKPSKTK
ncbi:preprotein translocase subunit SecG [Candidatus Hoaglandella endobia]|uniref:Protein-export membrane protein SecG n=1 Tax=Candidatus Hoaglandella endobia TaxID=1778263 RepID=A0A143WTW6_9ENTR|nr:preprotein translocase subunit SecG [Candidatus Hoaglandella endobia]CUX97042.1 Protein-export membrane protein SecG [Candidatus Hoaglandella endobia]